MISSQKRSGLSGLKARKSSRHENPSRLMKRQTLVCSTNSRDGSQITPGVWQGSGGGVKPVGIDSALKNPTKAPACRSGPLRKCIDELLGNVEDDRKSTRLNSSHL